MKRTGRLIVSVCLVAACGLAEFTEPVLVDVARSQQPWETIHTNAVSLAWDWDATNAVRAVLDIEGMNGSVTTQFSCATSNWLWRVSETAVPQSEDVYALTLTFYDASDAVVGGLTSRVAWSQGFGHARVDRWSACDMKNEEMLSSRTTRGGHRRHERRSLRGW